MDIIFENEQNFPWTMVMANFVNVVYLFLKIKYQSLVLREIINFSPSLLGHVKSCKEAEVGYNVKFLKGISKVFT